MKHCLDEIELSLKHKAWQIALNFHDMQYDKGGSCYMSHIAEVLRLVEKFNNYKLDQVAILHDLIEDTDATICLIEDEGFSEEVIEAIKCLTKNNNESYQSYIDRVSVNRLAIKVKIADLTDNMSMSRLKEITENDIKRLIKYHAAYKKLTSIDKFNDLAGNWL